MRLMLFALFGVIATQASAEVMSAGSNGFHIRQSVEIPGGQPAYAAFGNIGSWWNDEHTYSGSGSNLSLALNPGGCFCERLPGGEGIEHMRVSYVKPGERVVLTGSLGPLLFEATSGVMDVKFDRTGGASRVTMDYKVAGFATGGAEKLAPLVDQVLGEQMRRFSDFAAKPR